MIRGCRFFIGFVGCLKSRKKDKLVELEQRQQLFRDRDMSAMDRIERASVKCDPLSHSCYSAAAAFDLSRSFATSKTKSWTPMFETAEIAKNGLPSFFARFFKLS